MSARDGGSAASAVEHVEGEAGPRLGWGAAGALAGAGLAVVESALFPAGESALSVLAATGLGILVGGAGGMGLHAADRALRRVPGGVVRVAFPALAAVLGLVVASRLGAFTRLGAFARLGGSCHTLAVGVLVAGVLGGAWTGFAASLMLAPPAVSALVRTGQPVPPRILLSETWRMSRTGDVFTEFRSTPADEVAGRSGRARQHPPNLIERESPGPLGDYLLHYLEETSEHSFAAP